MLRSALLFAIACFATPCATADELLGNSATLTAPVPREFRNEDPANATWRQGKAFGYHLAVPAGRYSLELGFLEMIWRQPGQRVFDVLVDGKPLHSAVDLVKDVGRAPVRLTRAADVEVGADGLKVLLRATADEAPLAWLRLRDDSGRLVRDIDCGGDADLDPPSAQNVLGEQILPRFGSQAVLDLRPQFGDAILSANGRFPAEPIALAIGFEVDGVEYALPFASKLERYKRFPSVSETRTVTRLTYSVAAPGVTGSIEFSAPFHPGDLVGSGLPCFPVRFRLERTKDSLAKTASVNLFLLSPTPGGREVELPGKRGRGLVFRSRAAPPQDALLDVGAFVGREALERGATLEMTPRGARVRIPIDLLAPPQEHELLLVAQRIGAMLSYLGVPHFSVSSPKGSRIEDLVADFESRRPLLDAASRIVDSLVEDATYPESLKSLLRIALPSFLMNTVHARSADGAEYYACAEGYCRYHATLDVEAHTAPFYFWFAPDLLRRALEQWARCVSDDGVMCHDIGKDGVHGAQHYPHAMPIEENTNFVLLLHAFVARSGDREFGDRFAPLVERLLARVAACDTNGDGFADVDSANTIDDGTAAVQYARGQTYLAMKTAVAYFAAADLLRQAADPALSGNIERIEALERFGRSIGAALDSQSWRGTHYALTSDPSAKGLVNPWTAGIADVVPVESANAGNPLDDLLEGADSANGLAALGACYALESFLELPIPPDRLRLDLATAGQRIARRFVLAHAEHEINGWVSLSVLRDAVRTRLGDLTLDNCERYAALQARRNRLDDRTDWAGFCDSPYNRYLAYYPRGVAALSLVDALAGVRFDRRTQRLELTPMQVPLRIPLPQFADWSTLHVPWLAVMRAEDGSVRATLTEPDPFEGIDVTLDLGRIGGSRETWKH